jgi:hypothetical protein
MHTTMARGYRARTPSSRTMNSISCTRSVKALLHGSILPHMNKNAEAADKAQRGGRHAGSGPWGGNNIPGKSIPQWYAYRLFVKANRKVTCGRQSPRATATPTSSERPWQTHTSNANNAPNS